MSAEDEFFHGPTDLGPWRLVATHHRLPFRSDEGVATVVGPGNRRRLRFRGGWSIPLSLVMRRTWVHVGDPDSRHGVLVDCYQGRPDAKAKMFRATTGRRAREYLHHLAPGEMMNNSFVAITPDGEWMVSGEWGKMRRLLIFPTPALNPTATPDDLPLAGTIELDHAIRNVQGAVFVDPTTLLCSTNDPDADLWPVARQLLQVELPRPLDGRPTTGRVTCLGPLPLESRCRGSFEVEGIDYDETSGELRVVVIPPQPCKQVSVAVYTYRRTASPATGR